MTQNFIQPKGSLNLKVDTSNLQNQLAQMFANQQLQNQANNQPDEVRQSLNDLIKSKLMPVEVPQQVTIKDIINAGNTPDGMKLLGDYIADMGARNIQGSMYWNPQTKQMETAGDRVANERAEILKQRQAQALQQLKEQNDIATALNHSYLQQDIANEQNKLRRELAEQEMQFKREQMEEARREKALDRAQQMQMLNMRLNSLGGGASGGTATGGAANIGNTDLSKVKFTAADRKSLTENKTTLANIESGLKSLEENPNAYSFMKGILGSDITNRIDPKGVATRTQIDNITAVYRKWLTGAQMSDKERKAYERFLPAPTDNYNIVKSKLEGMRGAVQRSNDALLSNYGISTADEPAMPSIDNNALQAELKRRGLK